jgi:hypothetical protein
MGAVSRRGEMLIVHAVSAGGQYLGYDKLARQIGVQGERFGRVAEHRIESAEPRLPGR